MLKNFSIHRTLSIIAITAIACLSGEPARAAEPETLCVMTFNIWGGGEWGRQPLDQTIEVIRAAKADVVGIQESHGSERNGHKNDAAEDIAEKLGWHYLDQGDEGCGIVSRHKIVGHSPNKMGAQIELPSGRRVWHFNVHFMHTPYQPYQLLKIPYNDAPFFTTANEAVLAARATRGQQVAALLKEIEPIRRAGTPIFITGDFNEPSHQDWTNEVAKANRCPLPVPWPSTLALTEAGFTDTYRAAHPDPLKSPGHTWTPTTKDDDPTDRHDRIDFIFTSGPNARAESAQVLGEHPTHADIIVTPYPSDHRAVVATVVVE